METCSGSKGLVSAAKEKAAEAFQSPWFEKRNVWRRRNKSSLGSKLSRALGSKSERFGGGGINPRSGPLGDPS